MKCESQYCFKLQHFKKKYFNIISNTNLSSGSCVVVGGGVVMMQEGGVQLAWVSAPVSPITRRMYLHQM